MWEFPSALLGRITVSELALVAIIFLCIVGYGWAPKIGEQVGSMFDQDDE